MNKQTVFSADNPPKVYLSMSEGFYRVIDQGMPVCKDFGTAAEALNVATRFKLKIADVVWNGDKGEFQPLQA